MLEHLFGSKTRLRLLRIFFDNPESRLYVRELARKLGAQINAIRRELEHLEAAHIIREEKAQKEHVGDRRHTRAPAVRDRRKYYRLSEDGLINQELRSLLLKAQLFGEEKLIESIKKLGRIDYLLLTGIFVGLPDAPTDILVVGAIAQHTLRKLIARFEKEYGREVRYTLMPTKEFRYRRDVADRFLVDVMEHAYVVAYDKLTSHAS